MGRKKINPKEKAKTVKAHIPVNLYEKFSNVNIGNKSKLINELLENYFNLIEKGDLHA